MKSKEPLWSRLRRRWRNWIYAHLYPVPSNVAWLSSSCHIHVGPDGSGCSWTGWTVSILPTDDLEAQGCRSKTYGPFRDPGPTVDLLDMCAAAYIVEFPQIGFPK